MFCLNGICQNNPISSDFFIVTSPSNTTNRDFSTVTNSSGDFLIFCNNTSFDFQKSNIVFYNRQTGEIVEDIKLLSKGNSMNFNSERLLKFLNGKYTLVILVNGKKIIQFDNIKPIDFKKEAAVTTSDVIVSFNDNIRSNNGFGRVDGVVGLGEKVNVILKANFAVRTNSHHYWLKTSESGVKISKDSLFKNPTVGLNMDSLTISTPLFYPKYDKKILITIYHKEIVSGSVDSSNFYIYYDIPISTYNSANQESVEFSNNGDLVEILFKDEQVVIEIINDSKVRTRFLGSKKDYKFSATIYFNGYKDTINISDNALSIYEFPIDKFFITSLQGFYSITERFKSRKAIGIVIRPITFDVKTQSNYPLGLFFSFGKKNGFSTYILSNSLNPPTPDFYANGSDISGNLDLMNFAYKSTDKYEFNIQEIGFFRTFRVLESVEIGLGLVYSNYKFYNLIEETNLTTLLSTDKYVQMKDLSYNQLFPSMNVNMTLGRKINIGFNTGIINYSINKTFINANLAYVF